MVCACVRCRGLRPGRHLEDDDIVPELAHIHPRERPDWEETISAMVRRKNTHRDAQPHALVSDHLFTKWIFFPFFFYAIHQL